MNTVPPPSDECTIGDYVAYLAPSLWKQSGNSSIPAWPSDMFAIVASILNITGIYCKVVAAEAISVDWKPVDSQNTWAEEMKAIGKEWREGYASRLVKREAPFYPGLIAKWWGVLREFSHLRLCDCSIIDETEQNWNLCRSLFNLMAASDEACAGVGFPEFTLSQVSDDTTRINLQAWFLEHDAIRESHRSSHYGTTLCKMVHPSRVRVLPKLHTPRTGMTLRSLSLHLALCPAGEAKITWDNVLGWRPATNDHFNFLVVPWPMEIQPRDIVAVKSGIDGKAHPGHNLFAYEPVDNIKYKGYSISQLEAIRERFFVVNFCPIWRKAARVDDGACPDA